MSPAPAPAPGSAPDAAPDPVPRALFDRRSVLFGASAVAAGTAVALGVPDGAASATAPRTSAPTHGATFRPALTAADTDAEADVSTPQLQVPVVDISTYPAVPAPAADFDWRQRALDYDAYVYSWADRGAYTTISSDDSPLNMPSGSVSYKMPAYYGDTRINEAKGVQEAVNQIASVVGATLVGVDKSDQDGRNYVDMLRTFFHPDQAVAKNTPSAASSAPGSDSLWYTTMANVLYSMLGDQYGDAAGMPAMLRGIADRFYAMVVAAGGANADFTMQNFDFTTMTKVAGRNEGGDGSAGTAAILLWAAARFGDQKYLQGAKWAMDYLERATSDSLFYEVLVTLTPYTAARLNAEQGTDYDVSKYFDWLMQGSSTRTGWGTVNATWGGHDVSGLGGSRTDSGGYAFAMNSFANTLTAATAKYDARYANTVGRWMLNVENAARFFYADQMPAGEQYYGTRFIDDPAHVIAYEGLMHTGPDGIEAISDVPTRSGSWGLSDTATGLGLYGSSWVGFLAGVVTRTNVTGVLRTDLNALDFHRREAYPTYLYYNPGTAPASVRVALDGPRRLYDAVSDTVLAPSASGTATVTVPAGSSVVLVWAPVDGCVTRRGRTRLIDGVPVGYNAMPTADLAAGCAATATSTAVGSRAGDAVDDCAITAWTSGRSPNQTWTVDLGAARRVSRVTVHWGARYATRYTVRVSADGAAWSDAATVTTGAGGTETVDFTPARARYVRFALSAAAQTGGGYQIRTVQVCRADLAIGRPVSASTVRSTLHIASNLTDGSSSTRWESGAGDPQWFTVDLGTTRALGTAVVVWETAAAKAYTLQVSRDAAVWTTVYSTTSGAAGTATIGLPSGTSGRYLRMYGTQRATQWAYSAFGVELYGPNGVTRAGAAPGRRT